MYSVQDFVNAHSEQFGNREGFQRLVADVQPVVESEAIAAIRNATTCKRVLSHYYDTPTEQTLAIALKKFLVTDST